MLLVFIPTLYAQGNCQSGMWTKSYQVEQPVKRFGEWGNIRNGIGQPDASFVYCEADEIVISGAAQCFDPKRAWVHDSIPITAGDIYESSDVYLEFTRDGWFANCYGRDTMSWSTHLDSPARAVAICLKKQ